MIIASMSFSYFVWLMATTALVLPFLDLFWRVGRQSWRERALSARLVLALLELGAIALWLLLRGDYRILAQPSPTMAVVGAMLALTGALLSAWSKRTLGRHFSVHLGVQESHRLITHGPYAVVRHPMYLGIIDYIFGTALVLNDAGLLVLTFAFIILFLFQLRYEEAIFVRHFGDDYRRYQERVPALFPPLWPRRRAG